MMGTPDLAALFRRQKLGTALGPQAGQIQLNPSQAPVEGPGPQGPPVEAQAQPNIDPRALLMALAQDPSRQQYAEHMEQRPTWEEHKPGTGRKMLAILLSALAGPQAGGRVGGQIAHGPYNRAMGEWEREGEGLKETAGMGRQNLTDLLGGSLDLGAQEAVAGYREQRGEERGRDRAATAGYRTDVLAGQAEGRKATEAWRGDIKSHREGQQEHAGQSLAETIRANKARESKVGSGSPSYSPPSQQFQATQLAIAEFLKKNQDLATAFEVNASTGRPISLKPLGEARRNVSWGRDTVLTPEEYEELDREIKRLEQEVIGTTRGGVGGGVGFDLEFDAQGNPIQ